MMAEIGLEFVDFSAEVVSLHPSVGAGEVDVAAGTVLRGSGFPYKMEVSPEIVRECERGVFDLTLSVAEGDGDGGKFIMGGGSAIL